MRTTNFLSRNKWRMMVVLVGVPLLLARALVDHPFASLGPLPVAPLEPKSARICTHLVDWVCGGSEHFRDPTGAVHWDSEGEQQAKKIYEEIQSEHPNWTRDQIEDSLVAVIYTPKRLARLEAVFDASQRAIERLIQAQPVTVFTPREKRLLLSRIRRIKLDLPPPASVYRDERELLLKSEVYYERLSDGLIRLRVGGGYLLSSKSWFNLLFTMGHEMAHAIDPCEMRSAGHSLPAYDRVAACFLSNGLIAARRTRFECLKDDQLAETFADWLAVQITAEALMAFSTEFHGQDLIAAVANSVRDLCEQSNPGALDLEYHPSPATRIEGIFGRNAQIRELLGCKPLSKRQEACAWTSVPESGPR